MNVIVNGQKAVLPDFLMIGAAKSGTTTIYHYLNQHPDIYFPKDVKEPHYFCFQNNKPAFTDLYFTKPLVWQQKDYLALYQAKPSGKKAGDGSTSYLYKATESIASIKNHYGSMARQVPIIAVLRNPIERAFSHYKFLVRNGWEDLPFETALQPEVIESRKSIRWGFDYLEYGLYAQNLRLYLEHFEKVHVVLFNELKNPLKVSTKFCNFLEIKPLPVAYFPKSNPSGLPKSKWLVKQLLHNSAMKAMVGALPKEVKNKILIKRDRVLEMAMTQPQMSTSTRKFLAEYYEDSIKDLARLLNKDLTKWLQ